MTRNNSEFKEKAKTQNLHLYGNDTLSVDWIEDDLYGAAIVLEGEVNLNARFVGGTTEYFSIKTFKAGESILIRMIASRLPDNIEIELETREKAKIKFMDWDSYKDQHFYNGFDISSILMSTVDNLVELVFRAMAKKAYRSEDRMAIVLLEQVSMTPAHLDLYYRADTAGNPEFFVNIPITLIDVSHNWNISRTAISRTLHGPLKDAGVIRSYGRDQRTIVDLYCLRKYIGDGNITTPYV